MLCTGSVDISTFIQKANYLPGSLHPLILHIHGVYLFNKTFQNSFTGLVPEKTSC